MSKRRSLQSLFTEGAVARVLKEEDDSLSHETGASGDSLDAQVDRYFGQYEAAAKTAGDESAPDSTQPSVGQMEALDWRDLVRGHLITEAGEEDKDEETPGDAAPGADAMTGDDTDKLGPESLNVGAFVNDVVRMIQNYDSLLEVRSTLVRRAKTFLQKTYSDEVVQSFEDVLRDDHGIEAGKDSATTDADRFEAPSADRASGSAEPGMGGGGGAPPA